MPNAWLFLAAGEERQHSGNDGYDDEPDQYYSWDTTVSNGRHVRVGDRIVVWNSAAGAIGASVVESIESSTAHKRLSRCPKCGRAGLKERRTLSPRFRCQTCTAEFDDPVTRFEVVDTFRCRHDAAWVSLDGRISARELRGLAVSPRSFLSIRPLDWGRFSRRLGMEDDLSLSDINQRELALPGGHVRILTRARLGQREFRSRLIERFGLVCAITGEQPPEVLDAAHLYSYAEVGTHDEHGGLLLRRDVHSLFDRGLIMVEPTTGRVRVARTVVPFVDYGSLDNLRLKVDLELHHVEWLRRHWEQHRNKLAS